MHDTACASLAKGPYTGHLFVFIGKSRDKAKVLFWDRSGFVLYLRRLEQGRFQLPSVDRAPARGTRARPARDAPRRHRPERAAARQMEPALRGDRQERRGVINPGAWKCPSSTMSARCCRS